MKWDYGTCDIENVSHSSKSPHDLTCQLTDNGIEHVYVDGGATIQGFLSESLIDEITITTIPVLLGSGIPLFGSIKADIKLSHLNTTAYDFGFVQTKYSVIKKT
jgi:dihydrofolate reductase